MIRALGMLFFWGIATLIVGPLGILFTLLTRDITLLYRVGTRLAITGVRLAGVQIEVRGLERVVPGQSYIFMSNHASSLDPPILIPSIPGRCSVLVKKELFRIPILGTGMKLAQLVPVDRSNRESAIESVRAAVKVLRNGFHMVTFPEGTRTPTGGLLPFKKGPFHLAMDSGLPIIPVTIVGTYESWPKNRFSLRPGRAIVIFHEPIDTVSFSDRDALIETVRNSVASSLPPERRTPTLLTGQ